MTLTLLETFRAGQVSGKRGDIKQLKVESGVPKAMFCSVLQVFLTYFLLEQFSNRGFEVLA